MGIFSILPIIGPIVEKVTGIVDKAVTDKDLANKLKTELQTKLMTLDYSSVEKELEAQANIIVAESSGNWLQRSWRPILMLTIVAIVANNYLIFPYLSMFTSKTVILDLPPKLYNLMSIGVGGYIVGRSGEKIVKTWKK